MSVDTLLPVFVGGAMIQHKPFLESIMFTGMPGPVELIVLALIVLLLFGKRLPSTMRSLGQSIVEFKRGVKGIDNDIESETSGPDKPSF